MNLPRKLSHLALIASVLVSLLDQARAASAAPLPYLNPELGYETRVDDLVARLAVEEKIGLLMMDSKAVPRLGIPAYHWWNEGLHGYARSGIATVFPQAIGLAATWNPALQQRIGDVVSSEARAKFEEATGRQNGRSRIYQGLTIWSPNINIFRDPRWGRGQETYGEDPFLTGTMAVAFVKGIQGDNPHYLKAVATLKHFAVHSGPEELRHVFDAHPSAVDLHETYLTAFEMGVREAHAQSVMSVYNSVDGVPGPANAVLIDRNLRKAWGFDGAVVGDVDAVADIWQTHKFAPNAAEASALALKAGNDLCSGTTYAALPEALQRGLVGMADIDRALKRLLLLRFKLGLFDPAERCEFSKPFHYDTPAASQLALEAARQSMVLLKNDGTLPWVKKDIKILAVIGPTADSDAALLGNYAGQPSHPVKILDGLRASLAASGAKIIYEPGVPLAEGYEAETSFPSGSLFADTERQSPGLKLEIFENPTLTGTPASVKPDLTLRRDWNNHTLAADVPERGASLRWSGVYVPATSGLVHFIVRANSGFRIKLGDQVAVDSWSSAPPKKEGTVVQADLKAGEAYPICVEYTQGDKDSGTIRVSLKEPPPSDAAAKALAAARQADHILLTLGITPQLEGEEMSIDLPGFHGGDRTSIQLPAPQARLLKEVAALGKPVVVVLTTGSAISLDTSDVNALLCSWYYGQNGGTALAEILMGETNPSGRLPVTFYAKDTDLPNFQEYSMAGRTYRYFSGKPLFAFGHGLSYTTFAYRKAKASATTLKPDGQVVLNVRVTNTGKKQGDEVVQVYARELSARSPKPRQQLVAFKRISLAPGASTTLKIPVEVARLRHWDEGQGGFIVQPGDYALDIGASSDRILQSLSVKVR